MKYYMADDGQTLKADGDVDVFGVDERFREVTEEEYRVAAGVIVPRMGPPVGEQRTARKRRAPSDSEARGS